MAEICVKRYAPRKRHGGVMAHHSLYLAEDGSTYTTLSRSYHCICGEPLKDGDPFDYSGNGQPMHANCFDLDG